MTVTEPEPGARAEAPPDNFEPLVTTATSDRCSQCGAELAPDQRYCVECGTRRGRGRFGPIGGPARPGATTVVSGGAPPPRRAPRTISSNAAFLGTIALLLLAMGVGVLIGNSGQTAAPPSKVIVNGGGGSGTGSSSTPTASTTTPSTSPSTGSSKTKSPSTSKAKSGPVSATSTLGPAATKLSSHASKAQRKQAEAQQIKKTVPLKNGKHLAPETQKLGGSCSAGTVGCTNGKYTGKFF